MQRQAGAAGINIQEENTPLRTVFTLLLCCRAWLLVPDTKRSSTTTPFQNLDEDEALGTHYRTISRSRSKLGRQTWP
jgi:hypothetical protein